jgi:hypothetical protein
MRLSFGRYSSLAEQSYGVIIIGYEEEKEEEETEEPRAVRREEKYTLRQLYYH